MAAWGIQILSSHAESTSHERAKPMSERYFQHSKIKFVSLHGHVISSIYLPLCRHVQYKKFINIFQGVINTVFIAASCFCHKTCLPKSSEPSCLNVELAFWIVNREKSGTKVFKVTVAQLYQAKSSSQFPHFVCKYACTCKLYLHLSQTISQFMFKQCWRIIKT